MAKVRKVRTVKQAKESSLDSHNDPVPIPEIDSKFKGIIHARRKIDPETEWSEIREWLAEKPTTIQGMREAVRTSADMAARANDLYDLTKIYYSRFRIEYRNRIQLWRRHALIYWESVKKGGMKKQITEQMIEDQIIEEFTEEYADLQERMNEMETLKTSFKNLIDSVIAKGVDNRKLLESELRRPSSTPNWFDGTNDKSNG